MRDENERPLRKRQPTALRQAVHKAFPHLTAEEVDALVRRSADQERHLVLSGMNYDQAREIARAELFEGADPWEGDDKLPEP